VSMAKTADIGVNAFQLQGAVSELGELVYGQTGTARLTVTVGVARFQRDGQSQPQIDHLDVTLLGDLAEETSRRVAPGSEVAILGKMTVYERQGNDGRTFRNVQLLGTRIVYLSGSPEAEGEEELAEGEDFFGA